MTDPKVDQTKVDSKPVSLKTKMALAVLAAATAISPFTIQSEGTKHHAYLDPAKIPTICNGHTRGVKIGDVATDAQCVQYQKEDMIENMNYVLQGNPELIDHMFPLEAAGDFSYNAGIGTFRKSPMAAYFKAGKWTEGCNAFKGYWTGVTVAKPVPGARCVASKSHPGKLTCELGGLVKRRIQESKICFIGWDAVNK